MEHNLASTINLYPVEMVSDKSGYEWSIKVNEFNKIFLPTLLHATLYIIFMCRRRREHNI